MLCAIAFLMFSRAQNVQATWIGTPTSNANELVAESSRQQAAALEARAEEVEETNLLLAQILRTTAELLLERADELDSQGSCPSCGSA
jgi:hypothetical protein